MARMKTEAPCTRKRLQGVRMLADVGSVVASQLRCGASAADVPGWELATNFRSGVAYCSQNMDGLAIGFAQVVRIPRTQNQMFSRFGNIAVHVARATPPGSAHRVQKSPVPPAGGLMSRDSGCGWSKLELPGARQHSCVGHHPVNPTRPPTSHLATPNTSSPWPPS